MSDNKSWLTREMQIVSEASVHWPEWRKREAERKRSNTQNQSSQVEQSAPTTRSENNSQAARPPQDM